MASVARMQVVLDGFGGGKGVNTFHFLGLDNTLFDQTWVDNTAAIIRELYVANAAMFVAGTTMNIDPKASVFDDTSGALTAVYGAEWSGPVTSTNTSGNSKTSRATQACVRLITGGIVRNRILQGRHFLGPIGQGQVGSDGLIDTASATDIEQSYDGLLDFLGGYLAVWSQPRDGRPGVAHKVVSVSCNRVPGTLRSRKV